MKHALYHANTIVENQNITCNAYWNMLSLISIIQNASNTNVPYGVLINNNTALLRNHPFCTLNGLWIIHPINCRNSFIDGFKASSTLCVRA